MNIDQLAVGYEFPQASYEVNTSVVAKYLEAVGRRDEQSLAADSFVPPLAIAAYAMTALTKTLILPPGSIHVSQDFEFLKPVPVGSTIICGGRVAQRVNRGRLNLLAIEVDALNQDNEKVMTGKATLVLPS